MLVDLDSPEERASCQPSLRFTWALAPLWQYVQRLLGPGPGAGIQQTFSWGAKSTTRIQSCAPAFSWLEQASCTRLPWGYRDSEAKTRNVSQHVNVLHKHQTYQRDGKRSENEGKFLPPTFIWGSPPWRSSRLRSEGGWRPGRGEVRSWSCLGPVQLWEALRQIPKPAQGSSEADLEEAARRWWVCREGPGNEDADARLSVAVSLRKPETRPSLTSNAGGQRWGSSGVPQHWPNQLLMDKHRKPYGQAGRADGSLGKRWHCTDGLSLPSPARSCSQCFLLHSVWEMWWSWKCCCCCWFEWFQVVLVSHSGPNTSLKNSLCFSNVKKKKKSKTLLNKEKRWRWIQAGMENGRWGCFWGWFPSVLLWAELRCGRSPFSNCF